MGRSASQHRAERVRPRWGRVAALVAALTVTGVALLGGVGLGPDGEVAVAEVALDPAGEPEGTRADENARDEPGDGAGDGAAAAASVAGDRPLLERRAEPTPPPDSGTGRRAVFDQSEQRVWLVSGSGRVMSTYLVSGSVTDNLQPGTYEVFSRSPEAVGIDGSTMRWFVRFTRGPSGAAIGFHDLPVDDGVVVQTVDQLGTEQSHGCIRQRTRDAKRMWRFAPLGTSVVVTA